jgi:hypothetical protein
LFGRQITRISNSHGDAPVKEKLQIIVAFAIEGLKHDEFLVFTYDDATNENFAGSLLADAQQKSGNWKPLGDQIEGSSISYLDVEVNGDVWRLFKTLQPVPSTFWVALKKSVLTQRMFDILDVRDRMGLQLYPILILYAVF